MNNKFSKFYSFFLLLALVPILSACSLSFTSSGIKLDGTVDGGVFMSETKGDAWFQVSSIPTVNGQIRSLSSEDVQDIAIDPNDHKTLYLSILGKGLWYTNNARDGWNHLPSLDDLDLRVVRVDPENKCTIYTLSDNQILKTDNCGRDFKQIYQDDNPNAKLTTIAIDWNNHHNIYLGNSRGDILKSIDSGSNWRAIKTVENGSAVMKILISPQDSRRIFVASRDANVYSFISNTKTNPANSEEIEQNFAVNEWQEYNKVLSSLSLGSDFRALAITDNGVLFLATNSSLARSRDRGITWEKLTILTTDNQTSINALAVNQKDSSEIYYVTSNTLFRSTDSGVSWTTKPLPTGRSGSKLLVDYQNPSIIYLGVVKEQ
ncbi:MAG: WD40/YVTN/BNR-like repeat-containing protein [Patescibacteria group bacterium]